MELWKRQPGETAKAFYAFTLYRDMDPRERSLTNVAQLYNAKTNLRYQMARWSGKWSWVKRTQAYADYLDEQQRKATEEELQKMRKRHLTLSLILQTKAAEKLKGLEGENMRVCDAIRAVSEGSKLERLTRGESTAKIEEKLDAVITTSGPMPWEQIPEVKKALDRIREELAREKAAEENVAAET